jgi:elongation factor Ts
MAEITAKMVAELRAKTGAGILDCKKALQELDGDFEKAADLLREKGLASAAKKATRVAAEGRVYALVSGTEGALVEVNCETDFVGKGDDFKSIAHAVAEVALAKNPADVEALKTETAGLITEAIARIGENITVRRFVRYSQPTGLVHSYIHGDGRMGALVNIETTAGPIDAVRALAQDLCLQLASMKAKFLTREAVPAELVEHEKEILKAQAINEGKKPEIAEKMVVGRVEKFYKDVVLLNQEFVKDPDLTVASLLKKVGKEIGAEVKVVAFTLWERGEGIEKKADDFAAEVAKAAGLNQ